MTARFREGLTLMRLETVAGQHPRRSVDGEGHGPYRLPRCAPASKWDLGDGGLGYPIVPKGDDEIGFQMCADHMPADIDEALSALEQF